MVFAGIYPIENEHFEDLRDSLEKLQLNDSSLVYEPETSVALGFGFRCGFWECCIWKLFKKGYPVSLIKKS